MRQPLLLSGNTSSCGSHKSDNLIGQKFNMLTVIGEDYSKIDARGHRIKRWVCQCECGNTTTVITNKLKNGFTKSCGCLVSEGERKVEQWLQTHSIRYEKQFSFSDLVSWLGNPLRFDFAILDDNGKLLFLIEYQGVQHRLDHGKFGYSSRVYNDPAKRKYCEEHNIILYEIWYDQDIEVELTKIFSHDNTVPSPEDDSGKV